MLTLRSHRRAWVLAVWLAVLVQLHLFFIAQLHRHTLRVLEQESHLSHKDGRASIAALPISEPLDPACQIARQGSVSPASNIRADIAILLEAAFRLRFTPRAHSALFSLSSGRDPPVFS